MLLFQHFLFRFSASSLLLLSNFVALPFKLALTPMNAGFKLVTKNMPSEVAIIHLTSSFLTFDFETARTVLDVDAGTYLIHILTSCAAASNKMLFNVGFK